MVDTIAGKPGETSFKDGVGGEARFGTPGYMVAVPHMDPPVLYLTDTGSHAIRRITVLPEGAKVETVCGDHLAAGQADGDAKTARFNEPRGLALDEAGRLYVADHGNKAIRRVTFGGDGGATVDTVVGGFKGPAALAVDGPHGILWVADRDANMLKKVTLGAGEPTIETALGGPEVVAAEGRMKWARLNQPEDVVLTPDGGLFIGQYGAKCISAVPPPQQPDTLTHLVAGSSYSVGVGDLDGYWVSALFRNLGGLALDREGRLVAVDTSFSMIRRVTPDGWVKTIAGQPDRSPQANGGGYQDGPADQALFRQPFGVAVDDHDVIYVADAFNHAIRRIRPR